MPEIRAKSRPCKIPGTEYRCVVCGTWRHARLPALTCSPACRQELVRLRAKGERPKWSA